MANVNDKERKRRPLEVGDRVRMRNVRKNDDAYDEGQIISFTFGGARVFWRNADDVYTEALEDLERV
jgi:hypothetical protein